MKAPWWMKFDVVRVDGQAQLGARVRWWAWPYVVLLAVWRAYFPERPKLDEGEQ